MRLLLTLLLLFGLVSPAFAVDEDLTTYVESDASSVLTVTAASWAKTGDGTTVLYKDFGAGYFGDFRHNFDMRDGTGWSASGTAVYWALDNVNTHTSYTSMDTANTGIAYSYTRSGADGDYLTDFASTNTDTWAKAADNVFRFIQIERAGTTCTAEIYSDDALTSLTDTLSITCTNTTFQYFYADASSSATTSPRGDDYDLSAADAGGGGGSTWVPFVLGD